MGEKQGNDSSDFKRMGTKYLLSVMAACVAEFVTYPLDLTKTRLQIQGKLSIIISMSQVVSLNSCSYRMDID